MQLAIEKTAEVQKPSEGLEIKAGAGAHSAGVTTGRVSITSGSLCKTREVPK